MHPLHEALTAAADGRFPPVDGVIEVYPPMADGSCVAAEFTGHAFILTSRDPDEVLATGVDAYGGAHSLSFLQWLVGPDGSMGSHDAVLVAHGLGGGSLPERFDLDEHPRVARAHRNRRDVHIHGDAAGFVSLGRGLVDRLELSVELLPDAAPDRGDGRRLIAEGLRLVPAGTPVWAQVSPGNAASMRAFLAAGFVPVGAEVLIDESR